MSKQVEILKADDSSTLEYYINDFALHHEIESVSIAVRNRDIGACYYACVVYQEGKE